MERTQLLSLTQEELRSFLRELDPAPFRAKQVGEWLARGAAIEEMTNLPAAPARALAECAVANPVSIRESFRSKLDDTQKLLYELRTATSSRAWSCATTTGTRSAFPRRWAAAWAAASAPPRSTAACATSRRGRCWGRCWR